MIRPLRHRHRQMIWIISIFLPILFVLGIFARQSIPTMEARQLAVQQKPPPSPKPVGSSARLITQDDVPVHMQLYTSGKAANLSVEIAPTAVLEKPDILVYWTAQTVTGDELPSGASLLGSLSGQKPVRYGLPNEASVTNGHIVLYSLGHQALVGHAPLPTVGFGGGQ